MIYCFVLKSTCICLDFASENSNITSPVAEKIEIASVKIASVKSVPRLVRGQNRHFAPKGLVITHPPAVEQGMAVKE